MACPGCLNQSPPDGPPFDFSPRVTRNFVRQTQDFHGREGLSLTVGFLLPLALSDGVFWLIYCTERNSDTMMRGDA